jgi:hypothetical protein
MFYFIFLFLVVHDALLYFVPQLSLLGSFVENMYSLMCLGLPTDQIPVEMSGMPKKDKLSKWLKHRRSLEQQEQQERPEHD